MKKILIIFGFFLFFIQTQSFAQLDPKKVLYLKKIESYKRMRSTGFIMTGVGVLGVVLGVNAVAQVDKQYQKTRYFDEDKFVTGVRCVVLGIPLTAGGLVLGLIGTHKVKKYNQKLDSLSVNLNYSPAQKGLTVKYAF